MIYSIPKHFVLNEKRHQVYFKHSVFANTVNFIDSNQNLIKFHPKKVSSSAMAIIMEMDASKYENYFKHLEMVEITSTEIYFGNYFVSYQGVILTEHNLFRLVKSKRLDSKIKKTSLDVFLLLKII